MRGRRATLNSKSRGYCQIMAIKHPKSCFLRNICLQWLNVTDIFVPSGMALTAGLRRELLGLSLPCEESWASRIFVAASLIDHSQLHLLADLPESGNVRFPLCQYSLPLCCWRSAWLRLCHKLVFTQGRKFTQYDMDSLCLAFHFCPAQQLLAQGHFHLPCSLLLLVKENCGLVGAWISIFDSVLFNVLTGVFRAFHSATMVDGKGICIVWKTDDVTVSITTGWHTWYDRRIF